jgi:hypothetical protein
MDRRIPLTAVERSRHNRAVVNGALWADMPNTGVAPSAPKYPPLVTYLDVRNQGKTGIGPGLSHKT